MEIDIAISIAMNLSIDFGFVFSEVILPIFNGVVVAYIISKFK